MVRKITSFAAFALISSLGACASWKEISIAPRQFIEEARPKAIRVTKLDGSQSVIRLPELRNDSIMGDWKDLTGQRCGPRPTSGGPNCVPDREPTTSLAMADVSAAEVKRLNIGRTALAVIGVAVLYELFKPGPETVYECRDAGVLGTICGDFVK